MKVLSEYKMGGISFFIPCAPDEFTKDAQPPKPEEENDEALNDLSALADEINEEPEQHDDWYNNEHAFGEVNHIPETYK